MTYHIARAAGRQWSESAAVLGLRHATLINAAGGASHLEVRLYELRAGAIIPAHRHPFEESWYVFSGQGQRTVAGLTYQVAAGDYGFSPVGVGHALAATAEDLSWLSVRAPKPPAFRGAAISLPAADVAGEDLGRPSETDPRHRFAGHFGVTDLAPPAQLSMPGYHGPRIRNISVHMLVDRLLGAQHHTLFVAQIAPRPATGRRLASTTTRSRRSTTSCPAACGECWMATRLRWPPGTCSGQGSMPPTALSTSATSRHLA